MLDSKRQLCVMLVLLVIDEGLLFSFVPSSANITNSTDVEQLHPPMVEEDEEISEEIFEETEMDAGNSSNLQRQNLRGCRKCGIINYGNGIVHNGDVVRPPNKYPWMVQLQTSESSNQYSMCGGSIVSANYILTAAHCVKKNRPRDTKVFFLTNTHSLKRGPPIQKVIVHPKYDRITLLNDIALLRLKRNIICDKFKNPICLPPSNMKIPVGTVCTTAGWGLTGPGVLPKQLREGNMKLSDYSACGMSKNIAKIRYCFFGMKGKWQSSCQGDSGGPSFYVRNGKYYQVGVTSSGDPACRRGSPCEHSAVPGYRKWINQVMKRGRFSEELKDDLHCEQDKNEEIESGADKQQKPDEIKSDTDKQQQNEEIESVEEKQQINEDTKSGEGKTEKQT